MTSVSELRKLAKEAKDKYRSSLNKSELCKVLGMEPIPTSEKYERSCRGVINNAVAITLVNKKTAEKQEFTSI